MAQTVSPVWDRHTITALMLAGTRLFEADKLHAYLDGGGVPTEGTGSTVTPEGGPVKLGDSVTQAQDDAMLTTEMRVRRIPAIIRAVPSTVPLTEAMAFALASLDYNEGIGVLSPGNVITEMLEKGLLSRGMSQGHGWCIATQNGVRGVSLGLLRRRRVEYLVAMGAPLHPTYEQVWQMTQSALIGFYNDACSDAAAWRNGTVTWEVHTVVHPEPVPPKPVAPRVAAAPEDESVSDALDDEYNSATS